MLDKIKNNRLIPFVLVILFGLVLMFKTQEFLVTFNYVIVSIFAILGILEIISYIYTKGYNDKNYSGLIRGCIYIWLSFVLYVYYDVILLLLPIIISLFSFIMGLLMIILYLDKGKIFRLIIAIISFVFGILLLFMPIFSLDVYLKISGVYMVITSIIYVIDTIKRR